MFFILFGCDGGDVTHGNEPRSSFFDIILYFYEVGIVVIHCTLHLLSKRNDGNT